MADTIKPFGWVRDQRGTFEGRQTLDPMFLEGAVVTKIGLNGATYSPLYAAADVAALIRQMRDALAECVGAAKLGDAHQLDAAIARARPTVDRADAFLAQHEAHNA